VKFKTHPASGEPVPDEAALVPQWRYLNPRPAEWPQADFIVGNPPFIGASSVRAALGDGYVQALRAAWPQVPESADFVMHWWQRAAQTVRSGGARRFGLITTNSLRQTFNRRVIEAEQAAQPPLHLAFAIADHPWVDSAQGAAVRIAMTVGSVLRWPGRLLTVTAERALGDGEVEVELAAREGAIHADLRIGADVAGALPLGANAGLSSPGVKLHGAGFIITREQAAAIGLGSVPGLERYIREYRNGRDLAATPRDVLVIDLFGLTADVVRQRFPAVYQWVAERVKPERDHNNRATYRESWWIFGEPRRELRPALVGLRRYIATIETSKHRTFQFLDASVLPDNMLITIASDDAYHLGVLSSDLHVCWALALGGRLGVGNDPRYNKTRCFETFPFPSEDTGLTPALTERIRDLAEQLDAHRKSRQAAHADVTLTGLYNVLARLRAEQPLSAKEKTQHEHGLVAVLRSLHDGFDAAVLQAYGWMDLQSALPTIAQARRGARRGGGIAARTPGGAERQAPPKKPGTVRWLRPEFQARAQDAQVALDVALDVAPDVAPDDAPGDGGGAPADAAAEAGQAAQAGDARAPASPATAGSAAAPGPKRPWPAGLPEQIKAVAELLAASPQPLALADLEARFQARGRWRERLPLILDTLAALGRARQVGGEAPSWQAA
jgi:hypothetical protein